jgi:hypothetical protein
MDHLIADVERARARYLSLVETLSFTQGDFSPAADTWSIARITEHLVHAEQGGINLIWRAAEGIRRGTPVWTGESPNAGLSIEEVVQRTWRPRENSPESAVPRVGGPLAYWVAALRGCAQLLSALKRALEGLHLDQVIYPHALSGPLDARQRLEFLRFHIDRHHAQAERIVAAPGFPR